MGIASSKQKKMIGYSTASNYHVGRKAERDMCAELCSSRELSTRSLFRQGHTRPATCVPGHLSDKNILQTGRDRESWLRKGVPRLHGAQKAIHAFIANGK